MQNSQCQSDALRERLYWTLLTLETDGGYSQGMQPAFRSWKRQENRSPRASGKECIPAGAFILAHCDSDLQSCKRINLRCFNTLNFR